MRYQLLGTNTGLYASKLALGGASFGNRNGYGADKKDALQILEAYADAGGNFIDTSDRYQLGESEEIIGDFVKGRRGDFILCTKYTQSANTNPKISNYGNHRKAMRQAVEASLKRLQTDYIDIYMPHYDDGVTPWEEVARGLEDLMNSGKVIYSGLSNFPAWKASVIASSIKLTAIQVEYNLLQRTADRELIPMAAQFGLAMMMYSPLAGGLLTGKYRKGEIGRLARGTNSENNEDERTREIIDVLFTLAEKYNASPGQVAYSWLLSRGAFPIAGVRTLGHFEESVKAASFELNKDQLLKLEKLSDLPLGYPHELLLKVNG